MHANDGLGPYVRDARFDRAGLLAWRDRIGMLIWRAPDIDPNT